MKKEKKPTNYVKMKGNSLSIKKGIVPIRIL
jgi:hypothetical protein